ncbi:hypothetical protein K438DRAFT_1773011 [Mycena galopus ATCC 62051]|nr:hypothetical protein K438DRAFT_1773011 [Mycena galopus ATCC 62051]
MGQEQHRRRRENELHREGELPPLTREERERAAQSRESVREVSWIWTGAGTTGSDADLDEALRIEWCKVYARTRRWEEEVKLVEEEVRRMGVSLEYRAKEWEERARNVPVGTAEWEEWMREAGPRASWTFECTEGGVVYALKQAAIYRDIAARLKVSMTEERRGGDVDMEGGRRRDEEDEELEDLLGDRVADGESADVAGSGINWFFATGLIFLAATAHAGRAAARTRVQVERTVPSVAVVEGQPKRRDWAAPRAPPHSMRALAAGGGAYGGRGQESTLLSFAIGEHRPRTRPPRNGGIGLPRSIPSAQRRRAAVHTEVEWWDWPAPPHSMCAAAAGGGAYRGRGQNTLPSFTVGDRRLRTRPPRSVGIGPPRAPRSIPSAERRRGAAHTGVEVRRAALVRRRRAPAPHPPAQKRGDWPASRAAPHSMRAAAAGRGAYISLGFLGAGQAVCGFGTRRMGTPAPLHSIRAAAAGSGAYGGRGQESTLPSFTWWDWPAPPHSMCAAAAGGGAYRGRGQNTLPSFTVGDRRLRTRPPRSVGIGPPRAPRSIPSAERRRGAAHTGVEVRRAALVRRRRAPAPHPPAQKRGDWPASRAAPHSMRAAAAGRGAYISLGFLGAGQAVCGFGTRRMGTPARARAGKERGNILRPAARPVSADLMAVNAGGGARKCGMVKEVQFQQSRYLIPVKCERPAPLVPVSAEWGLHLAIGSGTLHQEWDLLNTVVSEDAARGGDQGNQR